MRNKDKNPALRRWNQDMNGGKKNWRNDGE